MTKISERGVQQKPTGSGAFAERESGNLSAPTAGGSPDLPDWYRERQLDLFGLPAARVCEGCFK